MVASFKGHLEVVKALLGAGASVEASLELKDKVSNLGSLRQREPVCMSARLCRC